MWEWNFKVDGSGIPSLIPIQKLKIVNELDCRIVSIDDNYPNEAILTASSDGKISTHFKILTQLFTRHAPYPGDNYIQHVRISSIVHRHLRWFRWMSSLRHVRFPFNAKDSSKWHKLLNHR